MGERTCRRSAFLSAHGEQEVHFLAPQVVEEIIGRITDFHQERISERTLEQMVDFLQPQVVRVIPKGISDTLQERKLVGRVNRSSMFSTTSRATEFASSTLGRNSFVSV